MRIDVSILQNIHMDRIPVTNSGKLAVLLSDSLKHQGSNQTDE